MREKCIDPTLPYVSFRTFLDEYWLRIKGKNEMKDQSASIRKCSLVSKAIAIQYSEFIIIIFVNI